MEKYNFKVIEKHWQDYWDKNHTFKTNIDKNKKKFYCLPSTFAIFFQHLENYICSFKLRN